MQITGWRRKLMELHDAGHRLTHKDIGRIDYLTIINMKPPDIYIQDYGGWLGEIRVADLELANHIANKAISEAGKNEG